MILVTVGTTMPFDRLIRRIDELVEAGSLSEPVLCQIGHGTYEPRRCEFFRFRPTLDDLFAAADVVVTHGGATVVGLLVMKKPFVAVPNEIASGQHQLHFLKRLAKQAPIYWTDDLTNLASLINAARSAPLDFDGMPSLADDLQQFISSQVMPRHRRGQRHPDA